MRCYGSNQLARQCSKSQANIGDVNMSKVFRFVVMVAMLLIAGTTHTANAAGLSSGCVQVNGLTHTLPATSSTNWWVIDQFYAGETVTITADLPVYYALGNGPGTINYQLNYNMSSTSFTFPLDQSYQIYFNNNQGVAVDVHITCAGNSPEPQADIPGPAHPDDFVLRTITCDTPVYNSAGGTPVAGAKITAGQTWFVSPEQINVGGTWWTEVFAGGWIDGFIPSACVGGKPADYAGQ
jgi:hypothetical protein